MPYRPRITLWDIYRGRHARLHRNAKDRAGDTIPFLTDAWTLRAQLRATPDTTGLVLVTLDSRPTETDTGASIVLDDIGNYTLTLTGAATAGLPLTTGAGGDNTTVLYGDVIGWTTTPADPVLFVQIRVTVSPEVTAP